MFNKRNLSCMIIVAALAIAAILPLGSAQAGPVIPGQIQINQNVINALKPVTFITPQGGETYAGGHPVVIGFETGPFTKSVRIFTSVDGGKTWDYIQYMDVTPGAHRIIWNAPSVKTSNAQVTISYCCVNGANLWTGSVTSNFFSLN